MRSCVLLGCLILSAVAATAAETHTLVLLPLANASGADEAPALVQELFAKRIAGSRWTIAPAGDVEKFLEERRVRYLDSLPAKTHGEMLEKFGAVAVVTGNVLAYRNGSNPLVAITARMIDSDGVVVWGEAVSLSAASTEGMLGIGRPKDLPQLAATAVERALRRFPRPGRKSAIGRGPVSVLRRGPATFRSAHHQRGDVLRVCVIPFTTNVPDASRVLMELLTVRLAASSEFEVVEAAMLREAMQSEKLYSISSMTSAELARLATHLGTTHFLRGNVYTYRDGNTGRTEVQLDMTLADVERGEIHWAVAHHRLGSEYAGLLQRGTVDNAIALADRVVSEAVAAQARARLRGPKAKAAPAATARKER